MINNYYKFLLGALLAINLNTKAQTRDCSELFFSEIVYAQDSVAPSGNSSLIHSYAVEIYNPKDFDVDLTNYYLKLVIDSVTEIDINLSGTLLSKGTFTITYGGSDSTVQQLADLISPSLDFTEKQRDRKSVV